MITKSIFSILFVILVGVLIFAWFQFGWLGFGSSGKEVPVSFDDPIVSAAFITYRFTSKIENLETNPSHLGLTLEAPVGEKLPVFLLKDVKVYKVDNGKAVQGSVSDLKESLRVTVEAFYDVKNSTWTPVSVFIAPEPEI